MVSGVTVVLWMVMGFLVYTAIPVVAMTAPVHIRQKVGSFYLKLGARALKQFTLVRRVLSGYDVLPINVDDEQKLLKVTLSSKRLGEDNEYRFSDPDKRISRLFNKPIAVAYEKIPAAVDAELAEWGYWGREKATEEGLLSDDQESVDPYVEATDDLRLVDPVDAFNLVPNDVNPENIKTAEKKTKERFAKYGSGPGLKESLRVIIGFAIGMGGIVGMRYVEEEMIGSGGGNGGAPIVGNATLSAGVDPALVMDAAVILV